MSGGTHVGRRLGVGGMHDGLTKEGSTGGVAEGGRGGDVIAYIRSISYTQLGFVSFSFFF